jgi:hypothetical protein
MLIRWIYQFLNAYKGLIAGESIRDRAHRYLFTGMVMAEFLVLVSIIFYVRGMCCTCDLNSSWAEITGISIATAGAAIISGIFFCFLFGVPKYQASEEEKKKSNYTPSAILGEIADWLTKIIVGLGLVELKKYLLLFKV